MEEEMTTAKFTQLVQDAIEDARPAWANLAYLGEDNMYAEGAGFIYDLAVGTVEWSTCYNPATETYEKPGGYIKPHEDLSLDQMRAIVRDLSAVVQQVERAEHVRRLVKLAVFDSYATPSGAEEAASLKASLEALSAIGVPADEIERHLIAVNK